MTPRPSPEPTRGWTDADALLVLAFGLLGVSGGIVAGILGSGPPKPQPITAAHAVAMLIMPAFAAALVFKRHIEQRTTPRTLLGTTDPLRDIARGLCIGLAVLPATIGLAWLTGSLIKWWTGLPPDVQPIIESLDLPGTSQGAALAAGLICIALTPAAEEILYRGILLDALRQHHGATVATILSSICFGLLHLHAPVVPALIFFGALLAIIRIRTGSLLACIAAHAMFNAANLMLALL
ncbi:MAG: CPBP family intramembrane glutamic endopeptidase [Kiritimatiellia bacterium]|jgi:membrane protease YdiL (CAAX protease family)